MDIQCFLLEETGKSVTTDIIIDGQKNGTRTVPIYKRNDNGEEMFWDDAPVGAIIRATWLEGVHGMCGIDGKSYVVKTPGGDWCIDNRASNCGLPDDNIHKCWCRHGEAPNFTVNKDGNTCSAGAGSIQFGDKYHGFLRNGMLTDC